MKFKGQYIVVFTKTSEMHFKMTCISLYMYFVELKKRKMSTFFLDFLLNTVLIHLLHILLFILF